MDSPNLEEIYQAIKALYSNPNGNEKEKASIWLGEVQKSIHSWKMADELLLQKRDLESYYFAAQTMRSKVQHNLSELPTESLISLRDSLVAHLELTTAETSSAIVTQLSLAVADLTLQMPTWNNCVSDLIKRFSTKNQRALLEILIVLPQEVDSTSLKLGENRRDEIKNEFRSNSVNVCNFLQDHITNTQNSNLACKIISCMTSWIQVRAINIPDVVKNAVIGFCFQVLRDRNYPNSMHEAAADCICALLYIVEDNNECEEVEMLLIENIAALENSYHEAVASEDDERALNYARVFTELAESFVEKIVLAFEKSGEMHMAMKSLDLVLLCVGHYDYEVAQVTFNFWYILSEHLYQKYYQPLTDIFKPHIQRLLAALVRHCQYEPDHTTQALDEGSEFNDFRLKVQDLIKDVVFIVGSSSVFRQMFEVLHEDISWEQTEAALFIMQAVAKNMLPEENEIVPNVVSALVTMPDTAHVAVLRTCVMLLGELCEWINKHPESLEPCLQMLLKALQQKQLAPTAAVSLQHTCTACRAHMGPHVEGLLQLVRGVEALALHAAAATALLRGVAAALGRLPPPALAPALLAAVHEQLSALAALRPPAGPRGSGSDPARWLDRLAALFRDLDLPAQPPQPEHPCLPALRHAWPVLSDLLDRYVENNHVVERWCRAMRFALRCVGVHAAPLLEPLAQKMSEVYSVRQHSCILYLGSILVDELSSEAACVPALLALLQALLARAFQLLQPPAELRQHPDTIDDLFRLCIRFLQRIPAEFLSSGALDAVLAAACVCAGVEHRDASASVMKFLLDAARCGRPLDDAWGARVAAALLAAGALRLAAPLLPALAEALLELLAAAPAAPTAAAARARWLSAALQALPPGPPAPTPAQLALFYQAVLSARTCKEMTKLFRDFSRLYR